MDLIERRSTALRAQPTLQRLYEILFEDENALQALYLDVSGLERTVTWGQCRQKALNAARRLNAENGSGHWIALSLDTCPEWLTMFFAIILSGNNALLLDPNAPQELTAYLLRQADAKALVSGHLFGSLGDVREYTVNMLLQDKSKTEYKPAGFGTKVALCTSGTTQTSRIFVYGEEALCNQLLNSELLHRLNRRIIDGEYTRNLVFLPCHHVFGFLVCMLWMSFIAGENVYLRDRSPQTILRTAQTFDVTMLITVPLLLNNLCGGMRRKLQAMDEDARLMFAQALERSGELQKQNPEKGLALASGKLFESTLKQLLGTGIRSVIIGGSFAPEENLRLFNQLGYYTIVGFGMTETGVTSVESDMGYDVRLSGSVGKPFESAEYQVLRPGSDGVGELAIRGRTLHTARLENGQELPPDLDKDGWFHTGDLVKIDDSGRLYIVGRSKDLIINESGENVYPDELEAAFAPPPYVDEFSVVGIRRKPGEKYEDITLVAHCQPGADIADFSDLIETVSDLNAHLPIMKQVTRLVVSEAPLPLSASMKVQRFRLREAISNHQPGYTDILLSKDAAARVPQQTSAPAAPVITDDREIMNWVRDLFAEVLNIPAESISDDARFSEDLKGDSLGLVSLAVKAEETFHVVIEPRDYGECTTVRGAARLIQRLKTGDREEEHKKPEHVQPITKFEDTPEYKAFAERQRKLMQDEEDNPYFVCHESPLTDRSLMDGQWVLNFGSYNYVGMSGRKETMEAAKEAIDKYGTSASGSRLLAGEKKLHEDLEAAIAEWKHAESAIVLVGGHSTNVTIVGNFCGKNDLILYDAIDHNSIMEGLRLSDAESLPFPHNDVRALEALLKLNRHEYEKVLIVVEGVYSMDGDIAPIPEYVRLKKEYGCFLMVDEAHSACVIGETGGGVDEYFHLASDDIDIKMGTLSKGLGTCGGYLAGKKTLIDYLHYNLPGFVFSVGMSPPLAAATLRAVQLLKEDPSIMADLRRNIACFVEEAQARGFDIGLAGRTAIIPIMIGKDEDAFLLSNMMRKKGVFVPPAVFPAVPRGKARLRFGVTSCHQPDQIREALDKLVECVREAGIELPK